MPTLVQQRPASATKVVLWVLLAVVVGGTMTGLYLLVSPVVAALVYVCLFLPLALARPQVALLLIFALTPIQNDLGAGGPLRFSIAEVNLILTLPVCLLHMGSRSRPLRLGPVFPPILLYLIVTLVSSLPDMANPATLVAYVQMVLFLVVTVVVFASVPRRVEDLTLPLYGLALVGIFFGLAAFVGERGYVLGLHKNALGGSLSSAVIISAELWFASTGSRMKKWLTIALLVETAGLIFTVSRGAWLATVVGLAIIGLLRREYRLMARVLPLLAVVVAVCWILLPEAEKEYVTAVNRGAHNVETRYANIAQAKAMFAQNPIMGLGVGVRKQMDATNLVWVSLAESGIVGLTAFILIYVVLLRMIWKDHKQIDLRDPMYSMIVLAGALGLARVAHGMVDHYWVRGSTVMCWAAVGMATWVHGTLAARTARRPAAVAGRKPKPRAGVASWQAAARRRPAGPTR